MRTMASTVCILFAVVLLSLSLTAVDAFSSSNRLVHNSVRQCDGRASVSSATGTRRHRLGMISFGGSGDESKEELPRDVKEAVSNCRQATQTALQKRISRMDIEFPVGTDFGVEKKAKPKGGGRRRRQAGGDTDTSGGPTQSMLDRSNRELARLFVEMFQPVGGDNIVVSFADSELADLAKANWKNDAGASCRVLAMNRSGAAKKKKKKKGKKVLTSARGFAAKMAAEVEDNDEGTGGQGGGSGPFQLPPNTEVALFVAPGPKELVVIDKICETVGMGTLVVLLNARLDKVTNFGTEAAEKLFTEDFESVFSLAAAPQQEAPGCLLYRAFPGDWVLARKPSVGRPKTILSQPEKPTNEECRETFDNLEISDLEKNVEGFVDNVAGWFR
ncbi:unnamed protein product [Pseudo-nitzschia multistriata]|uniref:DUF1995 domain-containing protein n=1 Tax=Pseudo-nitzschia multistriata TaxID=183589 RepID=A0A448Z5S3_9STRA|nr:unnamed protein product [Pseudo-nitzschia multistriata]